MEQKEQREKKDLDDFSKYKRISRQKKVAEIFAKISIFIFLICICILVGAESIVVNPRYETVIGISVKASDMLIIILYCFSGIFAIIGFLVRKTKLTKVIFGVIVILPTSFALGTVLFYLFLYIVLYPLIQFAWSSM